jgi:hypothetical protein
MWPGGRVLERRRRWIRVQAGTPHRQPRKRNCQLTTTNRPAPTVGVPLEQNGNRSTTDCIMMHWRVDLAWSRTWSFTVSSCIGSPTTEPFVAGGSGVAHLVRFAERRSPCAIVRYRCGATRLAKSGASTVPCCACLTTGQRACRVSILLLCVAYRDETSNFYMSVP